MAKLLSIGGLQYADMKRIRFLVFYDVRDARRLRHVARIIEGYGYRLQYSVFECALDNMRLQQLKAALDSELKHDEDQVMFVSLGESILKESLCIETLGLPYTRHTRVTII